MGATFVVEFDHREPDGPRLVGTFNSRTAAERWVEAQKFTSAIWNVAPLWHPENVDA